MRLSDQDRGDPLAFLAVDRLLMVLQRRVCLRTGGRIDPVTRPPRFPDFSEEHWMNARTHGHSLRLRCSCSTTRYDKSAAMADSFHDMQDNVTALRTRVLLTKR